MGLKLLNNRENHYLCANLQRMAKKRIIDPSTQLMNTISGVMTAKLAQQVVVLDLQQLGQNVCDYFIICHGTSKVQVQALAENVTREVKKAHHFRPQNTEGMANAEWVLLDYGDVVAHIFLEETRDFFKLEQLWADATTISHN